MAYREYSQEYPVDDLLNNTHEWRSVPEIVRLTLKTMSETLKSQESYMKNIEQEIRLTPSINRIEDLFKLIDSKVSRVDLTHLLSEKVEFEEMRETVNSKTKELHSDLKFLRHSLEEFQTDTYQRLNQLATYRDIERIDELLLKKADLAEVEQGLHEKANKQSVANAMNRKANKADIEALLIHKVDITDFQTLMGKLEEKPAESFTPKPIDNADIIKIVRAELPSLTDFLSYKKDHELALIDLNRKVSQLSIDLQGLQVSFESQTEIDSFKRKLHSKAEYEDIAALKAELSNNIQELNGQLRLDMRKVLEESQKRDEFANKNLQKLSEEFRAVKLGVREKQGQELHDFQIEFETYKAQKADKFEVRSLVDSKIAEVKQFVQNSIDDTVDLVRNLQSDIRITRDTRKDTTSDKLKMNLSELSTLIDGKADIGEVNKTLMNLQDALDRKADLMSFKAFVNEQSAINEVVCRENCVARWIWKSGELIKSQAIPWEIQSTNTCPENFMWEKGRTSLLTVAPGLYEVVFGIFSRSKPDVQLLVNDEAVVVGGYPGSKVWGQHPSGHVCGLTFLDYLSLPARARIALTYVGEPGAEGFIGLRKL